jgi:hypothetical protein
MGILPVILNRQASSLSHQYGSAPIRIGYGRKTFKNPYRINRSVSHSCRAVCPNKVFPFSIANDDRPVLNRF